MNTQVTLSLQALLTLGTIISVGGVALWRIKSLENEVAELKSVELKYLKEAVAKNRSNIDKLLQWRDDHEADQ